MSLKKSKGQTPKSRPAGKLKKAGVSAKQTGPSSTLREKAETALTATRQQVQKMSLTEVQKLIHELQVHQIELEMQNEELGRTQQELSEACDQYSELYDFAPVGFLVLDMSGTILEANLTACRLLEKDRASMIGTTLEEFFLPQDQSRFRKHFQSDGFRASVTTSDIFTIPLNRSNILVHIKNTTSPTVKDHRVTSFRVALIDVTAQILATRALEKQETWFSGILNTAMDAIITINPQQQVLIFNKAAEQMFRCSAQDAIGQSIERFIPERFRQDHSAHVRKFEQENITSRRMGVLGEITALREDGTEFKAEASISKVLCDDEILLTVICRDITTRKVIEAGLQFMSQQYQLLLHSVGEGIYGVDLQGHITFYNRAAESMTGWKQEQIRGKFIHSLIHHTKPDGTPYLWEECRVRAVLVEGTEHHVEDEVLWRKDGSSFHADYRSNPLHDENGQLIGAVVVFRDITERKEHHLQLLSLANRNQALLDAIPDLVVEMDTQKKMTWLNDEAMKFYGVGAIGKAPREYFVGEQDTYERIEPLFEGTDDIIHLESWQRRQDGEARLLEWWCRSIKDAQGRVIGMISTAQDVTEQRRESERVLQSEQRLRTMVEHLPDGAIFTDGTNFVINEAIDHMTGYSRNDLPTLNDWFRLVHGPDESIMKKLYQKDKKAGFPRTRLLPIRRKDGGLQYIEFARYGWEQGEVWLLHDVTDQHEAKVALMENKHSLEKSQSELRTLTAKLLSAQEDERRRISRDLHDDMNQRLAVLALHIQTGQQGWHVSDQTYQVFQQLYEEVSSLSDDIRHMAYQLHPSMLDDLGLKLALQSLVDDFNKWEKIPITFIADQVPAMLPPDISTCLYRLAQESMRNISKYSRATEVRVKLGTMNDSIYLEVEDDGVGFEPEAANLKKGLGLIGMQERVRLVNGNWSIVAHPGDGVTVSAWIPLPKEEV